VSEESEESGEDDDEEEEEFPCKKCGKSDQPDWILLCDDCDVGYHAACLRPALMLIPEGDWFCPHCEHKKLIACLEQAVVELKVGGSRSLLDC
jgi:remodeling and spacing factor 1